MHDTLVSLCDQYFLEHFHLNNKFLRHVLIIVSWYQILTNFDVGQDIELDRNQLVREGLCGRLALRVKNGHDLSGAVVWEEAELLAKEGFAFLNLCLDDMFKVRIL